MDLIAKNREIISNRRKHRKIGWCPLLSNDRLKTAKDFCNFSKYFPFYTFFYYKVVNLKIYYFNQFFNSNFFLSSLLLFLRLFKLRPSFIFNSELSSQIRDEKFFVASRNLWFSGVSKVDYIVPLTPHLLGWLIRPWIGAIIAWNYEEEIPVTSEIKICLIPFQIILLYGKRFYHNFLAHRFRSTWTTIQICGTHAIYVNNFQIKHSCTVVLYISTIFICTTVVNVDTLKCILHSMYIIIDMIDHCTWSLHMIIPQEFIIHRRRVV